MSTRVSSNPSIARDRRDFRTSVSFGFWHSKPLVRLARSSHLSLLNMRRVSSIVNWAHCISSTRRLCAICARGLEKSVSEIHAADPPRLSWMRVIAGGVLWAAVYNLVWGVAWFVFMRREWRNAFAAINRPLLFTADFWIFWIVLTLPIGVAIVAYAANPARSVSAPKATVHAGMTLWLVMTTGMATWSWQNSLSIRIIALDSIVNLVAMMVPAMFARRTPG